MWKRTHSFFLVLLLLSSISHIFVPLVPAQTNGVIDGDTVYIDDNKAYIAITPHTISDSQYVYLNVTSKVFTGLVDVALGFDSEYFKPVGAEWYNPHNVEVEHEKDLSKYFANETRYNITYTYESIEAPYVYDGSIRVVDNYYVYEPETPTDEVTVFSCDFDYANFDTYIVHWTETVFREWHNVANKVDIQKVSYDAYDMNIWYYFTFDVQSDVEYYLRIDSHVIPKLGENSFKYCVAFKRNSQTFAQAISSNSFYVLDPWYDSNWTYRKSHDITPSASAGTNYQVQIIVDYGSGSDSGSTVYLDGNCETDFADIRFTDNDEETLLDYWMQEEYDSDNATFWVEVADDLSSSNATIYMYYGNDAVSTTSNGTNTFIVFDDFNGASLDDQWTTVDGEIGVSGGYLEVVGTSGTRGEILNDNAFYVNSSFVVNGYGSSDTQSNQHWFQAKDAPTADDKWISYGVVSSSNYLRYWCGNGLGSETTTDLYPAPTVSDPHNYEVTWVSDAFAFIIDGDTKTTFTNYVPTGDMYPDFVEGSYDGYTFYVDWLYVRNFISSEPAHGDWGTEETSGEVPTDTEEYVDNNTSNVDSSADIGTQSNFTAQQSGPDQINDTLTEANIPELENMVIQYFNSTSSNVDSSADVGTESNPSNAQVYAPDSNYMTLQESNEAGSPSNSTLLDDGFESDTSNWDGNGSPTFGRVTQYTDSGETIDPHGDSYFMVNEERDTDFLASDDLDMSGASAIYISFWYYDDDLDAGELTLSYWDGAEYDLIQGLSSDTESQWNYFETEVTDNTYFISDFHIRFDGSAGNNEAGGIDDVLIKKQTGGGTDYELDFEYQWTSADYDEDSEDVCIFVQTASQGGENLVASEWNGTGWETLGTLSSDGWNNFTATELDSSTYTIRLIDSDQDAEATQSTWSIDCIITNCTSTSNNYRLDLEEQWTGLTTNYQYEVLCINTGAFSGAEDLQINVWNTTASDWDWVMNLTANQWNNVTVSDYLTASTLTIQFLDGLQTGDTSQSTWDKDCTLLHLYNGTATEYYLDGVIAGQIGVVSGNFVSFSRYCDVTPTFTVASLHSYYTERFVSADVTQVVSISNARTIEFTKYKSVGVQYSLFSSNTWAYSRQCSVYQLATVNGWMQTLQEKYYFGEVTPTFVVDSSYEWGIIKFGDLEVFCNVIHMKDASFTIHLSVQPLFVIANSAIFNEQEETIEYFYGLINEVLGVDDVVVFSFDQTGDVTQNFSILTAKGVELSDIFSVLQQIGINSASIKDMTAFGNIQQQIILNAITLQDLKQYGYISPTFTITSLHFADFVVFGAVNQNIALTNSRLTSLTRNSLLNPTFFVDGTFVTFAGLLISGAINVNYVFSSETWATFEKSGLINQDFSFNSLTLYDLVRAGFVNADFTINSETLTQMERDGVINEQVSVNSLTLETLSKYHVINLDILINGEMLTFNALMILGAINLDYQITSETIKTLTSAGLINAISSINLDTLKQSLLQGNINQYATINSLTLKDLLEWGLIDLTVVINKEKLLSLQQAGIINPEFTIDDLTLKDLLRAGIIDETLTIDGVELWSLLTEGLISEDLYIDYTKALSFNLFGDVHQSISITSALEWLVGTLLEIFGSVVEYFGLSAINDLPVIITRYLPVSRGLIIVVVILSGLTGGIIYKYKDSNKVE